MKRICCSALFRGLIEHRDGLEWSPESEGVFQWLPAWGFLPLMWCPYCGAEI